MNRMVVKSKVGVDGVLHLVLRVGIEAADKEVQVTVEPVPPLSMSQEEWRDRIFSTAGKWEGEFERPAQGKLEERTPLS